ncbi:hypothetical protein XBO1_1300007 [Xenorhabdus bovienii str. oregonense]|uniref:Uncharacterized protein n=1 Tax=Xenorhabdus bovienii str. oregonense TaxID=1398202 RepID=A0A077P138_XENBV|nr:hypothetical protein XBO1_1300007 [Xenorhabdus bovienii str. oregonense]
MLKGRFLFYSDSSSLSSSLYDPKLSLSNVRKSIAICYSKCVFLFVHTGVHLLFYQVVYFI